MTYIYLLLGTLFTVALAAQLLAYAAATKKSKAKTGMSPIKKDL